MREDLDLDADVVQALEQKPAVRVAENFAARVAMAAAAQPVARVKARRRVALGPLAAMTAMAVLTVVLFVVAPLAGTNYRGWPFVLEMLVLAQMAGIGYGLTLWERR